MSDHPPTSSSLSASEKRAMLARLLAERARTERAATPDATVMRSLSFAQQRLWFAEQLAPGTWTYHIPVALRLRGALKIDALEASLTEIVRRHDALRTIFPDEGQGPVAAILPAWTVRLVPEAPIAGVNADGEAALRDTWRDEIRSPFDIARGPLVRARLLRIAADDHVLLITAHHLVCDGLSIRILQQELAAAYNAIVTGGAASLPVLPMQYAEFVRAEHSAWDAHELDAELGYWKDRLNGASSLDLPADRPRPAHPSHRGGIEQRVLSAAQVRALRAVGQRLRVSLFMTLLASFEVLLSRYAAQDDILIGSPVSGRAPEAEPLIGCFVNTVVFRTDLSGDPTFAALVGRVRDTTLAAYERRTVPFDRVVEALQLERDMSRAPIVQVFANMVNFGADSIALNGLQVEMLDAEEEGAKFDLTLYLVERPGDLLLRVVYATDLFTADTIRDLLRRFELLLDAVAVDPDRPISSYPLMSAAEEARLVDAFNAVLA